MSDSLSRVLLGQRPHVVRPGLAAALAVVLLLSMHAQVAGQPGAPNDGTSAQSKPAAKGKPAAKAEPAVEAEPAVKGDSAPKGESTAKAEPPAKGKPPVKGPPWQVLFDGKTLGKWQVIDQFDYKHHGKVSVEQGRIVLRKGAPGTGIRWTGPMPKIDYEVTLEAMRVDGEDFFCGMTFPVDDKALTLVVGGWGGPVVGLSCINDEPAVENETCLYKDFDQDRWYRIRLRVTKEKIDVWIDQEQVIELPTAHRKFTLYWEVEPCLPFGIATWRTTGALRDIRVRPLEAKPAKNP